MPLQNFFLEAYGTAVAMLHGVVRHHMIMKMKVSGVKVLGFIGAIAVLSGCGPQGSSFFLNPPDSFESGNSDGTSGAGPQLGGGAPEPVTDVLPIQPDNTASLDSLSGEAISGSQIQLSWNTGKGAVAYKIERTGSNGNSQTIAQTTQTQYTDSSLAPNSSYSYSLQIVYEDGSLSKKGKSFSRSTCSYSLSNSLLSFSSSAASRTVSLTTGSRCAWVSVVSGSFVTMSGAAFGTGPANFTVNVSANSGANTRTASIQIENQTLSISQSGIAPVDSIAPSLPGNVSVATDSSSQLTISFLASTDASGIKGYTIRQVSPLAATFPQQTGTSRVVSNLNSNAQYCFTVQAQDNENNLSAQSDPVCGITLDIAPVAPANLVATTVSQTQINLSWTDTSNNESGFKIERAAALAGPYSQISSVNAGVTSFSNTGLSAGTAYFYRVRSFNAIGNSTVYSNAGSASTQAAPTPTPTPTPTATPTPTPVVDGSAIDCAVVACRYIASSSGIVPNATGSNCGTDWSNACSSLPATLIRGATYLVAGGSYPEYVFNTAHSGTSLVTVKKATSSDHGTSIGWLSNFGTQQAVFASKISVTRGHFVLDGSYRNESDWFQGSAYGFKIQHNDNWQHLVIRDPAGSVSVPNVIIKNLFIAAQVGNLLATGNNNCEPNGPCAINTDTKSSIRNPGYVFSRVYVEGSNNPFFMRNTTNPTIEYSASSKTSGSSVWHGEVVNLFFSPTGGGIIRYNHFRDAYNGASGYPRGGGTGVIAIAETGGVEIYGNIFENFYVGDGPIAAGWANSNIKVYNNTFIGGVAPSGPLVHFPSPGNAASGNVAYNNLSVNCSNNTYDGQGTFGNNGTDNTSVFVNFAAKDFRLARHTSVAGRTLVSPFNLDMLGIVRGSGSWDIGAYQFGGSVGNPTPTPVASSYTLSVSRSGDGPGNVVSASSGINCGSDCEEDLNANSQITLTAVPTAGVVFSGWSGACSGTNSCVITMNAAKSVNANFDFAAATPTPTPVATPTPDPNVPTPTPGPVITPPPVPTEFVTNCSQVVCKYVTPSGSGTGSGIDWANALPGMPTSYQRGATYFVASGTYSRDLTMRDNPSGTQYIHIKKAIDSTRCAQMGKTPGDCHGTNVGWNENLGTGQSIFTDEINFLRDYYILDGQVRNESEWNQTGSYGFRFKSVIRAGNQYFGATDRGSNIVFRYLEVGDDYSSTYTGNTTNGIHLTSMYGAAAISNFTVSRCYIHNVAVGIYLAGTNTGLVEHNHIGPTFSKEAIIGHVPSTNWTIRHNDFVDSCQGNPNVADANSCSAVIASWANNSTSTTGSDNWHIYGNLFLRTPLSRAVTHTEGIIIGGSQNALGSKASGWKVYNNIFATLTGNAVGISGGYGLALSGTNNYAYNNLWYNIGLNVPTLYCRATSCQKNWCYNPQDSSSTKTSCGNIDIKGIANPFNNVGSSVPVRSNNEPIMSGLDFHLKPGSSLIDTGYNPGAGYNVLDKFGRTRGADGAWDIGAYESED